MLALNHAFKDFILTEMNKRGMSARQFASFVGVTSTTINRTIDPREPVAPSIELLVKLAMATQTDVGMLVKLAYPEVEKTGLDSEALALAQQISALPEDQREVIRTYLLGLSVKMGREKPKNE